MANFFNTMPGVAQSRRRGPTPRMRQRRRRKGGSNDDDDEDDEDQYDASEVPSLSMGGTWVSWPDPLNGIEGEGVDGRTASRERTVYMILHVFWAANIITSAVIAKFASDYIEAYENPGEGVDGTQVERQNTIQGTANMLKYFPGLSAFFGFFYLLFSWYTLSRRTSHYAKWTEREVKEEGKGIKSLAVLRAEFFYLFSHFIIYFTIGFVLYNQGSNRKNKDNGKGIELASECTSKSNFFCNETVSMNNAVWAAAVFSGLASLAMGYAWYAHPGKEAAHYTLDLSLRFQRNAYYCLAVLWVAVAAAGAAICSYAGDYLDEYRKPGKEQREILDLVKFTQGFSGALLAGGGAILAILIIWSTRRYTSEEHHEHSASEGIHSLNITWLEWWYTFICFVLITAFAIALATGGWRAKRLNTNRGFAMYMSCKPSDQYCTQTKNMGISMFVASGFLFPAFLISTVVLYKHPVRKEQARDPEEGDDDDGGGDLQSRAAGLVRQPPAARLRNQAYRQQQQYAGNRSLRPTGNRRNNNRRIPNQDFCQEPGCRNNCRRGADYCKRHEYA